MARQVLRMRSASFATFFLWREAAKRVRPASNCRAYPRDEAPAAYKDSTPCSTR